MSWCASLSTYHLWNCLGFLDLGDYFLFYIREVFSYNFLKYVLISFHFLSFFWNPYNWNVGAKCCPRGLWDYSYFFFFFSPILFSLFCSGSVISTILSCNSLIHFSASVIQLPVPFSAFLKNFSYCILIVDCLFFSSSISVLYIS